MSKKKIAAIAAVGFVVLVGVAAVLINERMKPSVAQEEPLPKAQLTTVKGEPLDLAKLKGKVVVLDFWSST